VNRRDGRGQPRGPHAGDGLDGFPVLAGDITGDGQVNFDDVVPLAQNYNTTNKTCLEGDLNVDHKVDFADLVMLAQRYNTVLAAPAVAAAVARENPAGTADGVPINPHFSTAPIAQIAKPSSIRRPSFAVRRAR
jgi:hypothetical protein